MWHSIVGENMKKNKQSMRQIIVVIVPQNLIVSVGQHPLTYGVVDIMKLIIRIG